MFKKIMSIMLAIVMVMGLAAVAASAAQVEIADNSADAVVEVAADAAADTGAEAGAETAAGNKLYFEPDTAGWKNYKKVFCHIWTYGGDGDDFYAWQAKGEACVDNKDGKWYYDLDAKGVTLNAGTLYAVIFSNENGMQTYDLLFDSSVIGDSAYCDGTTYENPADSSKTALAAFWRNQDPAVFGPVKCITSIGNVVGTCVPSTTSSQSMFEGFLTDNLENARTYSGKDDQTLLDDTAAALNLKQGNVTEAIAATGVKVDWSADKSSLPTGVDESAKETATGEKKGGTGSDTGSSDSSNTSSTSKTNTSTAKTGQETTVLFIMLGVMAAAAAVVVIARKRENA